MDALFASLGKLAGASGEVLAALGAMLAPWTLLFAWLAYWLFAVNWDSLWPKIRGGGWIAILLIGLIVVLVWGVVSPAPARTSIVLGLTVSNFAAKCCYVTLFWVLAMLCGTVQLSGALGTASPASRSW